ncbi:MAG: 3-deoxy-D-manno-octulosonic acid transferase [Alphaproteobacteria bacterium]
MLTKYSGAVLSLILSKRIKKNKEVPERIMERKGITDLSRPDGDVLWIHAASVGEAQSALILIKKITNFSPEINILVTTGTVTSSELMNDRLPLNATHQFFPLDHPKWVKRFINHWQPSAVLWMESELWPNMLNEIKINNIPAILVNAHMSDASFSSWKKLRPLANKCLSTFTKILCQTPKDKEYFNHLGSKKVIVADNIKYSSDPLTYESDDFIDLNDAINGRPVWVFASTHDGEELLACETHKMLKKKLPNLLTVIVPRHPQRRSDIKHTLSECKVNIEFRSDKKTLPSSNTDIYIADTLGELGLFYSITPIACIGRSFSKDGGGGHNPIEAAQLECAVLHGPNVQNLQDIFDDMNTNKTALKIENPEDLYKNLLKLLTDKNYTAELQKAALEHSNKKNHLIDNVVYEITSTFKHLDYPKERGSNAIQDT